MEIVMQQHEQSNEIAKIRQIAKDISNDDEDINQSIDVKGLQKINPDIVAWLYIPDTSIDYPIVRGKDNTYYLTHTYMKNYNYMGSIFMDYRQDFKMPNIFIYGHNVRYGAMFKDLEKYKNTQFFEQHKTVYLYTEYEVLELQVMSFLQTTVTDNEIFQSYENRNEKFQEYAKRVKTRSMHTTSVEVEENDSIINFVTCSYAGSDGLDTKYRYVLQTVRKG